MKHFDRKYFDRKYFDRKYFDRKYFDRKYFDIKYLAGNILKWNILVGIILFKNILAQNIWQGNISKWNIFEWEIFYSKYFGITYFSRKYFGLKDLSGKIFGIEYFGRKYLEESNFEENILQVNFLFWRSKFCFEQSDPNLIFQRDQTDRGLPSHRENGWPVSPPHQLRKVFALHQHDRQHSKLARLQVPQDLVPRPQRDEAPPRHRSGLWNTRATLGQLQPGTNFIKLFTSVIYDF